VRSEIIIPPEPRAPEKVPNTDPELTDSCEHCGKVYALDIRCPRCRKFPSSAELLVLLAWAVSNLEDRVANLERVRELERLRVRERRR